MTHYECINPNNKNPIKVFVDTTTNLYGSMPNSYVITESQAPDFEKYIGNINFQNGPLYDNPVNGCQIEDILSILIDRMKYFQCGNFACRENEVTLKYLELAMQQLNLRTTNREARNVEGKNLP